MAGNRRAFVISPIGMEGSPVRQHADDVFDYIITPAMEECGIQAYRSDHMHDPGRISEQMFGSILHADLCIAVLTGHNPNVFYELAVAQSFGRPVIMLIQKGEVLPFDIHDLRCVQYDLSPRPLFERVYSREIAAHVHSLDSSGWQTSSPIGVTANGHEAQSPVRYVERSASYAEHGRWLPILEEATAGIDMMGISLGSWRSSTGFRKLLEAKAEQGVGVRLLLMHPENPALPELINQSIDEADFNNVRHSIEVMSQLAARIVDSAPGVAFRQVRRGVMHGQLTLTDVRALYVPYLFGVRTIDSPLLETAPGTGFYDLMQKKFDALWDAQPAA
ncbi:MAG TPA: hypothetical protein VFB58_09435 [Chloroflexota bacterium]|nr:hypothetical protein [Chloroflexota bacterium]